MELILKLCVFSPLITFLIFLISHYATKGRYIKLEIFLIILQVIASIVSVAVFKFYFIDLSISIFE